jgi:hypothetical protein
VIRLVCLSTLVAFFEIVHLAIARRGVGARATFGAAATGAWTGVGAEGVEALQEWLEIKNGTGAGT